MAWALGVALSCAACLPGPEQRVPLDVRVNGEEKVGKLIRRHVTYQSDHIGDRIAGYLFLPPGEGRRPAVLCLHQTNGKLGKDEPAGLGGNPNLHYALHLAELGFVTFAPDYPSFGESSGYEAPHRTRRTSRADSSSRGTHSSPKSPSRNAPAPGPSIMSSVLATR